MLPTGHNTPTGDMARTRHFDALSEGTRVAKNGRLYRAKNVLGHEIESSRRTDHTEDRGRVFFVDITILVHSMLFAGLVAKKAEA